MRNTSILFAVMLLLFLSSCGSPLVKPMLDDTVEIMAGDGTNFTVRRIENNIPDQEICMAVSCDGREAFYCYDIADHLDEYEYSNDIVEKYGEIIREYHSEEMNVYQFYWGVVYTLDGGTTFSGAAKHNYKDTSADNDELQYVLETIGSVK